MKKGVQGSNEKSNLLERKYYQCYCAKNYQSYSALYLHVKNKHNQNLSFKSFNQQRVQWSGSVKNIILEFDQEYQSGKKPDSTARLNLRRRSKKICFKQSEDEDRNSKQLKIQENIKVQQQAYNNPTKNNTVRSVLEYYQKSNKDRSQRAFRSQFINSLMNFINSNYQYYFHDLVNVTNFCDQYLPHQISVFFTDFFLRQYSHNREKADNAVIELIKLQKWLFQNNFTYPALVKTQPTQQNMCKFEQIVQEEDKIKVQSKND